MEISVLFKIQHLQTIDTDQNVLVWRFRNGILFIVTGQSWKRQTPPGYCRIIWDDLIEKFNVNYSPRMTIEMMMTSVLLHDLEQTFAAVAKIKSYDGRISSNNRSLLSENDLHPTVAEQTHDNPLFYDGLDRIHSTHINQMITALYEIKEIMKNE